jgi:hypothetical protein
MSLYKFLKSTSRLVVVSGASLVIATDERSSNDRLF